MLITKFGINIAFTLCYLINAEYFPAIVCSRIFGICNIFARISTILSPLIAEIAPPVPMLVYVLFCAITMVASIFLTKNDDLDAAMQDLDDSISMRSSQRFQSAPSSGATMPPTLEARKVDGEKSASAGDFDMLTSQQHLN